MNVTYLKSQISQCKLAIKDRCTPIKILWGFSNKKNGSRGDFRVTMTKEGKKESFRLREQCERIIEEREFKIFRTKDCSGFDACDVEWKIKN